MHFQCNSTRSLISALAAFLLIISSFSESFNFRLDRPLQTFRICGAASCAAGAKSAVYGCLVLVREITETIYYRCIKSFKCWATAKSSGASKPAPQINNKKLSYRRKIARRAMSVIILSTAAQLYEKPLFEKACI